MVSAVAANWIVSWSDGVRRFAVNILIVGHDSFENKGCEALVITTTKLLGDAFQGANCKCFSWDPEYDAERFQRQSDAVCEFIRHGFTTGEFSLRNKLWLFLRGRLSIKTERLLWVPKYFYAALSWADIVVVSGGDILADYGAETVRHYFFPVAVAQALNKPVYIFAQSISRYNDDALRRFCVRYLNKAALITVREEITYKYVRELGIVAPCYQTADPAFLLDVCSQERIDEIRKAEGIVDRGRPTIGFSVSRTATKWGGGEHGRFVKEVGRAIDQLAEQYPDARFLVIPHVTYRNDPENDDRVVGREVKAAAVHSERIDVVKGDYTCTETKGLIGACDVFVGARTHATIASSSQCVPTLALAYSTKAYGIMGQVFDRECCVLDVREVNADRLANLVSYLLENRKEIVDAMRPKVEALRAAARRNAELARELLG